jgi:nucleoside-diphosphate-sugar epimerase
MAMRILLLGGTGNLSSACAAELRARGHQVLLLTRGQNPVPPGFEAVVADRKDPAGMRRALAGRCLDVVVNFIGYEVSELELDYELFGHVRQYIFISSATVYAKPPPRLPITEDTPLGNPFWEYARKKQACEEWLWERWRSGGFPVTIVRPSHTYSERWIPNPISSAGYAFAARLERGAPVWVPDQGENPWTLTWAGDFAAGLAGLVGQEAALGEAFHITSDEVLTWNQIYREIAAAVGVEPRIVPVPTEFICEVCPEMVGPLKGDKAQPAIFDNSKLRRLVPDFRCRVPFREGIRRSVAWLRAHPEHQRLDTSPVDKVMDAVLEAWARSRAGGGG